MARFRITTPIEQTPWDGPVAHVQFDRLRVLSFFGSGWDAELPDEAWAQDTWTFGPYPLEGITRGTLKYHVGSFASRLHSPALQHVRVGQAIILDPNNVHGPPEIVEVDSASVFVSGFDQAPDYFVDVQRGHALTVLRDHPAGTQFTLSPELW